MVTRLWSAAFIPAAIASGSVALVMTVIGPLMLVSVVLVFAVVVCRACCTRWEVEALSRFSK